MQLQRLTKSRSEVNLLPEPKEYYSRNHSPLLPLLSENIFKRHFINAFAILLTDLKLYLLLVLLEKIYVCEFELNRTISIEVMIFLAVTGSERIFITTPRSQPTGYPATIGVVTKKRRGGNPVIDPYPSWSWQINPEKCNYHRIVSVFRVWVSFFFVLL